MINQNVVRRTEGGTESDPFFARQCHDTRPVRQPLGGMRRKHRHDVRTGWKETFGAVKNKERCYAFGYFVSPVSKSLWVTQRFNNELWEIDPATRKVKTKIAIGREPVAMAPFAGDSCLLIANNLPEMPSTAYPIAVSSIS